MIGSKKNTEIERQRLEIAINTRRPGITDSDLILPYDPTNTPDDEDGEIQVIAPNWLDNSDFDFSKSSYLNDPPIPGDTNHECYNFYRQRFVKLTDVAATATSVTVSSAAGKFKSSYTYPMDFVLLNGKTSGEALSGTLTRVNDNTATLSVASDNNLTNGVMWFGDALAESAARALKASSHSLYAANEGTLDIIPRWDKTNGWAEIGSDVAADDWDIATPLPLNFIRGGITYYFKFIVSQRAGTTSGNLIRFFAGIWDATATQKRFLESSNFDLSISPVGTTGSTSYEYVVIADLDDGTTVMSDVVTVANGNAVLSTTNYNRLTWENAAGVLNFRIYRRVAGVVKRIFTIRNGGHDYNDYGTDEGETPVSLPTASGVRPIVYRVSGEYDLNAPGSWRVVTLKLEIPSTYNTSQTTDKQWLRFGIEGHPATERLVMLDRVMLSTSNGGWQRSARDLNKILNQNPDSNPGGGQGNTGIGTCFVLNTQVIVCDRDGQNMRQMEIGDIVPHEHYVFSGARKVYKVVGVKDGVTNEIISITLDNGIGFECTPSEKFITSRADKKGTRIDDLSIGDEILCYDNGKVATAKIAIYKILVGDKKRVRTLTLKGGHVFVVTNGEMKGALAHNEKPI